MASLTPARVLGREKQLGSIANDKVADFVLFDDDFAVHGVWVGGERVFGAHEAELERVAAYSQS